MEKGFTTFFGADVYYEKKCPRISRWLDVTLVILFVTWLGSRMDFTWGMITLGVGVFTIIFNNITTKVEW
jgi:hypothetical protein